MRHTSSHTKNRRSHHALKGTNVVADKESGALRLPHTIDETTGMYRGKQIVSKKEVKKADKKTKAKEKAKAEEHVHAENTNQTPMKKDQKTESRDKKSQGMLGRMITGRAKARSGMGGQAGS